ncbi:hypothetical protein D9M70_445520 [compost metagenome]
MLLASGTTRLREPFFSRFFSALAMLAAASIRAFSPREAPEMTSGRLAASRASAMRLTSSAASLSRPSTAGALGSMAWATAKPMRARSAGAAWTFSAATSSRRVAATLAMNSGFSASWATFCTAAMCQSWIFIEAAISVALPLTAWRRARAMRAAVWVRSSPRTKIASCFSTSRRVGTGSGPFCRMSRIRRRFASSWAAMPE